MQSCWSLRFKNYVVMQSKQQKQQQQQGPNKRTGAMSILYGPVPFSLLFRCDWGWVHSMKSTLQVRHLQEPSGFANGFLELQWEVIVCICFPGLLQCLTFPQSVGIMGGHPKHSLYFVGHKGTCIQAYKRTNVRTYKRTHVQTYERAFVHT